MIYGEKLTVLTLLNLSVIFDTINHNSLLNYVTGMGLEGSVL